MTEGVRVFVADAVAAGLCTAGIRQWAGQHKLSFRALLTEGIPIEELRALNCALGNRAVDQAQKRADKAAE